MNSSTLSSDETIEIFTQKILPGNLPAARGRLILALESLDYQVIEDEPNIVARKSARGWATWYGSSDALDYPRTLTLRLKANGEGSTRVSFDYLVKHPMLLAGDKGVVLQEAETITSLCRNHSIASVCSVCATESTGQSKFCRKCGAPLTSERTELAVLRLIAETRAAKTSVMSGGVSAIVALALFVLTFVLNSAELLKPKLFVVLLGLAIAAMLTSIYSIFFANLRLSRALKVPEAEPVKNLSAISVGMETGEFQVLPPHTQPASVTEGTTNLLDSEWANAREKVPLSITAKTKDLE